VLSHSHEHFSVYSDRNIIHIPALPARPALTLFLVLPDHNQPFSGPCTPVLFATTPQYCFMALFRTTHSGSCFLSVQGFKDGPMGTEFQSSSNPLFPYIYRSSDWLSILLATCLLAGLPNLFLRP
jgi:hypothetical protein